MYKDWLIPEFNQFELIYEINLITQYKFMPIEIRELVIKASVDQNKSNASNVIIEEQLNKIKLEIMNELSYKIKNLIKETIYKR